MGNSQNQKVNIAALKDIIPAQQRLKICQACKYKLFAFERVEQP